MPHIRPVSLLAIVCTIAACSAVEPIRNTPRTQQTAIKLEVHPPTAKIYVDGNYKGRVEGWRNGLLPVEPGSHRIALRADGYIDQRFDISLDPGETYRLDLGMERSLSRPADSTDAR